MFFIVYTLGFYSLLFVVGAILAFVFTEGPELFLDYKGRRNKRLRRKRNAQG